MHWSYGTSWGLVYGALSGSTPTAGGPRRGLGVGTTYRLLDRR
ncbi:MAG: hypothetical protein JWP17_503 [Solirubrobacterales bacterium]|jgi:hypothetical protein|nr:hypothetical protein [Solirubrobacterales bacterium]